VADILSDLTGVLYALSGLAGIFIQIIGLTISFIPSLLYMGIFIFSHIFSFLIMFEIVILAISVRKTGFLDSIRTFYEMNYFLVSNLFRLGGFLITLAISLIQSLRG
jgi:hypothetical protein